MSSIQRCKIEIHMVWPQNPKFIVTSTCWISPPPPNFSPNSKGQASVLAARDRCQMEYKQFTVGVLNATLDLAALVLVGVVGFLGSEVVLSAVVSRCLPSCGGWVLVGVVGFLGSEVVLSPVVSHCLRLSPFMWGVGVGWCGRLLGL